MWPSSTTRLPGALTKTGATPAVPAGPGRRTLRTAWPGAGRWAEPRLPSQAELSPALTATPHPAIADAIPAVGAVPSTAPNLIAAPMSVVPTSPMNRSTGGRRTCSRPPLRFTDLDRSAIYLSVTLRDEVQQRTAFEERRSSYAGLNTAARRYHQQLEAYLRMMTADAITDEERAELAGAREKFRQLYSDAQMILPDNMLDRAASVTASFGEAYGRVKRLEIGKPRRKHSARCA